ncbi:hypothetical protein DN062_14080 [Nitrincola tibetensis]|uniref:Uncharacterized protein n=1 Tax=Nitrincola tibetensis TaxID=2219697 RepID=A0A364NJP1_9GAMM|nr:hypothetical protein [Nitrincola tibetensis]RAU17286.1 hypothetical protein DN062_14080 [Nitrincola tibetensis]
MESKSDSTFLKILKLKLKGVSVIFNLLLSKIRFIDTQFAKRVSQRTRRITYTVIAAIILYSFAPSLLWNISRSQVTFVMEGRDRIADSSGEDRYEIYTSEGIFLNQNSLLRLKRNSSTLQGRLKFGATYQCKVQGYHSVWFKKIRNIISCNEVNP